MMKIYSITDGYIDYLQREHKHVYSNKENQRSHTRKYIGVVLEINNMNYYIPLSSPKDRDYETIDGTLKIRKDSFTIFRIKSKESDGSYTLKGTLQFASMIPVPDSELELYDINREPDVNYKNLVLEELIYIRKNAEKIKKAGSPHPL